MRLVFLTIASTSLMSCLVTESIPEVQIEDLPTSVVSQPDAEYPLHRVIKIDRDVITEDINLAIEVRDPNLGDTLETQIFVVRQDGSENRIAEGLIRPTGEVTRESVVRVPVGFLGVGCAKIELLISNNFMAPRIPMFQDDLYSAVWWVAATNTTMETVDMGACPE